MIDKQKGNYSRVLLRWECKHLLERFSTLCGRSQSAIIANLIETYLPLEVNKFCEKMEAQNEKTQTLS